MSNQALVMSRRQALGRAAALALPGFLAPQPQDNQEAPELYRPDLAGRPRERITDYENDPFIVGIEGKLRCTCGCNLDVYTCRTTDFTCGVSPAMHREVVGLVEDGMTGEDILEAFVAKYGETVLMAPRKEGFNWAGYVVPGAAISLGGAVLAWVLLRRTRRAAVVAGSDEREILSDEEQSLIDEELEHLVR
ncbi:MAG TPA: cytochrome c-type biogenesis protein CcmH [Gemmatimonadales bacterium]